MLQILTMKNQKPIVLLAALILPAFGLSNVRADIIYNDDITAIFGSGNPNGGFTAATTADGDGSLLTLAERFKDRPSGSTTNTDGVYTDPLGGLANLEFSIDTGSLALDAFTYTLAIDTNPTSADTFVTIDPTTYYSDNSYGTDATGNGGGTTGLYSAFGGTDSLLQNSEKLSFAPSGISFATNGTYDAVLSAYNSDGRLVDQVTTQIVIGSGGATVPDTAATAALLGLGLAALVLARRKLAGANC